MKHFVYLILSLAVVLGGSSFSFGDVFRDGNFELTNGPWIYGSDGVGDTNNADQDANNPEIDSSIEGNQSLFIGGRFINQAVSISTAYQDITVGDDTPYLVGDIVRFGGLLAHTATDVSKNSDPIASSNPGAKFRIDYLTPFGSSGMFDSEYLDSTYDQDVWHEIYTPDVEIIAGITGIRVTIMYEQNSTSLGNAWADNIRLINVPEPGSVSLLGLGLIGMIIRRRRS